MSKQVIVVLGAPNAPDGKLSKISRSRLDCCRNIFQPGYQIICTGGWGKHFNTAPEAHASYAVRYLINHGIPDSCFLPNALSENTVDDAVKVASIISRMNDLKMTIITSDFHIERVKLVFQEVLSGRDLDFVAAASHLSNQELELIMLHEKQAIQKIKKNGLYY